MVSGLPKIERDSASGSFFSLVIHGQKPLLLHFCNIPVLQSPTSATSGKKKEKEEEEEEEEEERGGGGGGEGEEEEEEEEERKEDLDSRIKYGGEIEKKRIIYRYNEELSFLSFYSTQNHNNNT